jgi:hypothetical protein
MMVGQGTQPRSATTAEDQSRRERALQRVVAVKAFYIHLLVFVLVLAGLLLINLITGEPWWVQWVFAGWGIGVLAHGITISGPARRAASTWEERKLKQFMDEDRSRPPSP